MLDLQQLIDDFEACIGWPYASPGSNDERGIDCSGMFVRAYRRQGARIYHGSNTIWRRHLSRKGLILSADDLQPGMAVFKWKAKTPEKFEDDLGDFFHIGLVTSVSPLRIVHASTQGMQVKADTKLGKWQYWGVLSEVEMPAWNEALPTASCLRRGSRGSDVKALQRALRFEGYELKIDGIFGYATENCVKTFQSRCGLERDGVVGPLTWAALGGEAV